MMKRLIAFALGLAAIQSPVVAQVAISNLPSATTPLSGTEAVPCVQSGITKKCLTASLSQAGTQTANTVLAAPNGSAGTPTFRALLLADLPASVAAAVTETAPINTIEQYRLAGYTDQQTVTAWAAAISAGTINMTRMGNALYAITAPVTITLPLTGGGGLIDMGGVTFQRNYSGGGAVLTVTENNGYVNGWYIRPPRIDNHNLSGDQITFNGGTSSLYGLYGCVIDDAWGRNSIGGNGLTLTGNLFECVINKPDFRAVIPSGIGGTGGNTTGYGIYLVNSGGGVLSSLDFYGADTDGYLNGIYLASNGGQDTRWYGGTAIRAWHEGFLADYLAGSVFGFHVEDNWFSGTATAGVNGAGIRVSGSPGIFGIVGNSDGGQLYPLQVFASGNDATVQGVLDQGTPTNLGILQTNANSTIDLIGLPLSEFSATGANVTVFAKGRIVSPEIHQTLQFLTGATPTPVYGAGNLLQVALTANATIGAPTTTNFTPSTGDELTFVFIQGATPYTVTFNSIYSTRSGFTLGSSAYQYTTVRFVNFNGTWHQSSPEVVSF